MAITRQYTSADLAYISANYLTLEALCAERPESPAQVEEMIDEARLPKPSYVLDDGIGMFPADYFCLVDEACGLEQLRDHFAARHRAAALKEETTVDRCEEDWEEYLNGTYGICLRRVTPEGIVRKTALVSSVSALLVLPRPRSPEWRRLLREQLDELDAIERAFAPDYDRAESNDGPPTRDLLIRFARHRYPAVFADVPLPTVDDGGI